MIKKLFRDILISVVVLIIINIIGQYINFHIPFNLFTILLLGVFKIPGLIIILIMLIL